MLLIEANEFATQPIDDEHEVALAIRKNGHGPQLEFLERQLVERREPQNLMVERCLATIPANELNIGYYRTVLKAITRMDEFRELARRAEANCGNHTEAA